MKVKVVIVPLRPSIPCLAPRMTLQLFDISTSSNLNQYINLKDLVCYIVMSYIRSL